MDLNDLRDEVHKLAVEKGWWEGVNSPFDAMRLIPEKIALIHSELSEALEEYRIDPGESVDSLFERGAYYASGKPEGFCIELADAIIRILDLCGALGLDIEAAVNRKHHYNKSRPHRHGGKRA